jgi:hypothetical protein
VVYPSLTRPGGNQRRQVPTAAISYELGLLIRWPNGGMLFRFSGGPEHVWAKADVDEVSEGMCKRGRQHTSPATPVMAPLSFLCSTTARPLYRPPAGTDTISKDCVQDARPAEASVASHRRRRRVEESRKRVQSRRRETGRDVTNVTTCHGDTGGAFTAFPLRELETLLHGGYWLSSLFPALLHSRCKPRQVSSHPLVAVSLLDAVRNSGPFIAAFHHEGACGLGRPTRNAFRNPPRSASKVELANRRFYADVPGTTANTRRRGLA